MSVFFIVWNKDRSEGFVTSDPQLAYEVRKCATTNCYTEEGHFSVVGQVFAEAWGVAEEQELVIQKLLLEAPEDAPAPIEIERDDAQDIVTIEGVRYAQAMFRQFGGILPVGQAFEVVSMDGTLVLKRL